MSIKLLALPFLTLIAVTEVAHAQPRSAPTIVRTFGAWGVYSYSEDGAKRCYALSSPQRASPADVDHGSNYFLAAPDGSGRYYPQAIMGYDLAANSAMSVSIDGKTFAMAPRGNSGWAKDASDDPVIINAMKSGSSLALKAVSKRGTRTSYEYSLAGITAALNEAQRCR